MGDAEPMWGPILEDVPIGPPSVEESMRGASTEETLTQPPSVDEALWEPLFTDPPGPRYISESQPRSVSLNSPQSQSAVSNSMTLYETFRKTLIELHERLGQIALPRQILPMVLARSVGSRNYVPPVVDDHQTSPIQAELQHQLEAHRPETPQLTSGEPAESRTPDPLFIDWLDAP